MRLQQKISTRAKRSGSAASSTSSSKAPPKRPTSSGRAAPSPRPRDRRQSLHQRLRPPRGPRPRHLLPSRHHRVPRLRPRRQNPRLTPSPGCLNRSRSGGTRAFSRHTHESHTTGCPILFDSNTVEKGGVSRGARPLQPNVPLNEGERQRRNGSRPGATTPLNPLS